MVLVKLASCAARMWNRYSLLPILTVTGSLFIRALMMRICSSHPGSSISTEQVVGVLVHDVGQVPLGQTLRPALEDVGRSLPLVHSALGHPTYVPGDVVPPRRGNQSLGTPRACIACPAMAARRRPSPNLPTTGSLRVGAETGPGRCRTAWTRPRSCRIGSTGRGGYRMRSRPRCTSWRSPCS